MQEVRGNVNWKQQDKCLEGYDDGALCVSDSILLGNRYNVRLLRTSLLLDASKTLIYCIWV